MTDPNPIRLHSYDNLDIQQFEHQVRKRDENVCLITRPLAPSHEDYAQPDCSVVPIVPAYLLRTPPYAHQEQRLHHELQRSCFHHLTMKSPEVAERLASLNLSRNLSNYIYMSKVLARQFKRLNMWLEYQDTWPKTIDASQPDQNPGNNDSEEEEHGEITTEIFQSTDRMGHDTSDMDTISEECGYGDALMKLPRPHILGSPPGSSTPLSPPSPPPALPPRSDHENKTYDRYIIRFHNPNKYDRYLTGGPNILIPRQENSSPNRELLAIHAAMCKISKEEYSTPVHPGGSILESMRIVQDDDQPKKKGKKKFSKLLRKIRNIFSKLRSKLRRHSSKSKDMTTLTFDGFQ
ncbi:hypothetical protein TWF281_011120 [Arthrobotrys megalospora]